MKNVLVFKIFIIFSVAYRKFKHPIRQTIDSQRRETSKTRKKGYKSVASCSHRGRSVAHLRTMRSVYVSLTCLHEASQASLHHGGSAVDVLLLRLQRRQLTQHVLAGVLQTLTTSRITHTHTHTHEHTRDEWPTATKRRMEMEEDK